MKRTGTASLALGLALASPLAASAQTHNHTGHRGHMHVQGRIVSIEGTDLTLDTGAMVFLKSGTVIKAPKSRGQLHAGEIVTVYGSRSGDRNIDANEVDVQSGH